MRNFLPALAFGALGALLLPGALALVACLLCTHTRCYRQLHQRAPAALRPGRRDGRRDVWASRPSPAPP